MSDEAEPSSSGFGTDVPGDVDDYISANEGEPSLPWDIFSHVFDLVKNGNQAFRENRFEEAINCYSRANNIKPCDPVILGNRCAAYIRISKFLRHIPASASEYRARNGLDPTTHAELALKDVEKLMNLRSNSEKAFILKTEALVLLERYDMARDVILSGLQVDPFSNPLRECFQNLERIQANFTGRRSHRKAERSDDFDCTLCLKLPYEPVTTPCGHFMLISVNGSSVTLNGIIQKNFQEEFAEMKLENDAMTNFGVDLMPLFVTDGVFLFQKFSLHVF